MSLQRIRMNTTATITGCYTFALNPSRIDLQDKDKYNLRSTLDAGQIKQTSYFDATPIVMSWTRIPSGLITNFSTMLSTLYSYKDTVKYINYGDADYRIATPTWNKVLVVDVEVTAEPGGKILRNVTMILTPEL